MSMHGKENGLSDPATMAIIRNMLVHAGVPYLNDLPNGPKTSEEDRVAQTSKPEDIKRLIQRSRSHLAPGHASYLTWLIEAHGHQDCLIGKHARSISDVIAHYLGTPDPPPPREPATQPVPAVVPASVSEEVS